VSSVSRKIRRARARSTREMVEVRPGTYKQLAALPAAEILAAQGLLDRKQALQRECAALLRELEPFLPKPGAPAPIPDWCSPFTRRVLTRPDVGDISAREYERLRDDLARWCEEIDDRLAA